MSDVSGRWPALDTVRPTAQRVVPFQLRLARLRVMYELRSIILRAAGKGEYSFCRSHLVVGERPAGAGQSGPGRLPRWIRPDRLQLPGLIVYASQL